VDTNSEQLERQSAFHMRLSKLLRDERRVWRTEVEYENAGRLGSRRASDGVISTEEAQSFDSDPEERPGVFLSDAVVGALLLVAVVAAIVVFALRALRHW
jgi:hypothetical protein